ncbi:MAG: TRAP transporter fused permease subunit [Acidobacteriota bacterium]
MSARDRPLQTALAVALTLFTLAEVNYPNLSPQTQLAIFAGLGLIFVFTSRPLADRWRDRLWSKILDYVFIAATLVTTGWIVTQNESLFETWWASGSNLGNRAGAEVGMDYVIGALGLVVVLEAARRTVGLALPILSLLFLAYAKFGSGLPDWLFPHRGYDWERIVAQTFLHSQGVFGVALNVMFVYVFLFVVFGSFLEATGATSFILDRAQRLFRGSAGAPAKVSVLASGLMGSLSGSAVANTATTGTFTIPLMRNSGFRPHVAGGVEAAASSGGALVPPVMGAGAYMMLEIINPPVTYLEIVRAALLPAILYYLSLFLIVHFWAKKIHASSEVSLDDVQENPGERPGALEGLIFFGGLSSLIVFLLMGFTVFRAVSLALGLVILLSLPSSRTRVTLTRFLDALWRSARAGVPLIAAAACVGIILGVVTLTGVGTALPATILPLAESNLFLALVLLMISSIILGMGLPSAVCYLLLATLVGPVLGDLGVPLLGAHLFIFYYGLMSMVTPPVALAGYTAASIANAPIMKTSLAAFRFSLLGFALPFLFIYRPQLLMLDADGSLASPVAIGVTLFLAILAVYALAGALAGQLRHALGWPTRAALVAAAALLFFPIGSATVAGVPLSVFDGVGIAMLVTVVVLQRRQPVATA